MENTRPSRTYLSTYSVQSARKSQKRFRDTPRFKFQAVLARNQPFLSRSVKKRGDQSHFKCRKMVNYYAIRSSNASLVFVLTRSIRRSRYDASRSFVPGGSRDPQVAGGEGEVSTVNGETGMRSASGKKTHIFMRCRFILTDASFYQDRLGTNILV